MTDSQNGRHIINSAGLGLLVFESIMAKVTRELAEEHGFGIVSLKASNSTSSIDRAEKDLDIIAYMVTERTGNLPYLIASSAAALPALSLAASRSYQVFQAMVLVNPVPSLREGVARLFGGKGRHLLPLYDSEISGVRAEIAGQAILRGLAVNPGGPAAPILRQALNAKPLEDIASQASSGFRATPMLYMLGEKDNFLPRDYGDTLSSRVPHARVILLEGLDHALSRGTLQTIASRWPGYMPGQVGQIARVIGDYFRAASK